MASTFSLILVVVCAITGVIWCLDKMIWSKQRAAKIAVARAHGGAHLDENPGQGGAGAGLDRADRWVFRSSRSC